MSIDSSEFRRILGHWVTGVSVVAARDADGRPCGLTANAVASLSLHPPLVLVCVDRTADSHDCIRNAGYFAISVLASDGERLARRFAAWDIKAKFDGVAHHPETSGAPVLDAALAWVDCRLHHQVPGGDHTIFIGEVLAGDAREGSPLLYYRGGYGRFMP
jgi:flavin reductase (DIM6/NTAB) family NADH-FMN oxidoreductase RutF